MKQVLKTIKHRNIEILVLFSLISSFLFPHYSLAIEPLVAEKSIMLPELVLKADKSETISLITPIKEYKILEAYDIPITAYSSTVDQCDDTPCITANGFNLCAHNQEDVIAANFLPFGTKVRIPELFGDRQNERQILLSG